MLDKTIVEQEAFKIKEQEEAESKMQAEAKIQIERINQETLRKQQKTIQEEELRKTELKLIRKKEETNRLEREKKQEEARKNEERLNKERIDRPLKQNQQSLNLIKKIISSESNMPLSDIAYYLEDNKSNVIGANINYQNLGGYTALMAAISSQKDYIAIYLLKKGADPFLKNKFGETARDLASNNSPIYDLLKERERALELDKLKPTEKYSTLLHDHIRTFETRVQKIDDLLEEGADINYQDSKGYTALMYALDMQNDRIAEYLLSLGANPLLKNKHNKTARSFVSRSSSICGIIKGYELLNATTHNNLPAIKSLLHTDNSIIDFQGDNGYSALLVAVEQNNFSIVEYLILKNASLTVIREDGMGVFDLLNDNFSIYLLLTHANDSNEFETVSNFEKVSSDKPGFFKSPTEQCAVSNKTENKSSTGFDEDLSQSII